MISQASTVIVALDVAAVKKSLARHPVRVVHDIEHVSVVVDDAFKLTQESVHVENTVDEHEEGAVEVDETEAVGSTDDRLVEVLGESSEVGSVVGSVLDSVVDSVVGSV